VKTPQLVWILALLFYVSGCTAYAPVYLPGDPVAENQSSGENQKSPGRTGYSPGAIPDDPQQASTDPQLKPGQTVKEGMLVRIILKNDETVEGTVVQITEDALVFGKPGNYGLDTKSYTFQDIESMEASRSTKLANVTGIFVVVAIVLLVALGATMAAGMSGGM
jgi:hypothetical protein